MKSKALITTNKFLVRPDYEGMAETIKRAIANGDHNHGYMTPEEAIKIFTGGYTDPKRLMYAGFSECSTPDLSFDVVEYKDGTDPYPRKVNSGNATLGDVTLSKGRKSANDTMNRWALRMAQGGAVLMDLWIIHFDLNLIPSGVSLSNPTEEMERYAIRHKVFGAMPQTYKGDGDLSGSGGDIAMEEITLSISDYEAYSPRYNEQNGTWESVLVSGNLDQSKDIII